MRGVAGSMCRLLAVGSARPGPEAPDHAARGTAGAGGRVCRLGEGIDLTPAGKLQCTSWPPSPSSSAAASRSGYGRVWRGCERPGSVWVGRFEYPWIGFSRSKGCRSGLPRNASRSPDRPCNAGARWPVQRPSKPLRFDSDFRPSPPMFRASPGRRERPEQTSVCCVSAEPSTFGCQIRMIKARRDSSTAKATARTSLPALRSLQRRTGFHRSRS